MAKCVSCTELNSLEEESRHPNSTTRSTRIALQKRSRQFSTTVDPNKFCELHGNQVLDSDGNNPKVGTASPSGMFIKGHVNLSVPFSTKKYESDKLAKNIQAESGKNEPVPDEIVDALRPKKKVKKVKVL